MRIKQTEGGSLTKKEGCAKAIVIMSVRVDNITEKYRALHV